MAAFEQRKKRILEELQSDEPDLSPKGKPDEEILGLLELINSHEDYISTSSCSGRAVVFLDADKSGTSEEAQGRWLMTRHTQFEKEFESSTTRELYATLFDSMEIGQDWESSPQFTRLVALKFEPLVKKNNCNKTPDLLDYAYIMSRFIGSLAFTSSCNGVWLSRIRHFDFSSRDPTRKGTRCHKNDGDSSGRPTRLLCCKEWNN